MSMPTPGPWQFDEFTGTIFASDMHGIAAVTADPLDRRHSFAPYDDPEQRLANARLICAAPELLEALRDLYPHLPITLRNIHSSRIESALHRAGADCSV